MKKVIFMLSLIAFSLVASSQTIRGTNPGGFSLGLEAGVPVGEIGKLYSHILGGTLQYEYKPDAAFGITFNTGYLSYSIKKKFGGGSVGFIPALAGVKYYLAPAIFAHAQLGAAFGTDKGQGTSFAYSPGIGFNITPKFDVELKYTGISNKGGTLASAGARLAYTF